MTGATSDTRPVPGEVTGIFGAAVRRDGQPSRTLGVRVADADAVHAASSAWQE